MSMNKSVCLLLTFMFLCSCGSEKSYVQQEFCGKYDLPSDFSEAMDYIESKLDESDRREAYQQLIVDNPQSFYFDFNTIEEAPHYETSPDGKFRIYHFYIGMHENPPILQFCNNKGKIITTHITAAPLYPSEDDDSVKQEDYGIEVFASYARVLGQQMIKGAMTYLVLVSDYHYSYVPESALCEFVTGLQLTETGYRYVSVFEYPTSGYIHKKDEDEYYVKRIRSVWPALPRLHHGNAWYDEDRKVLHIPHSVENPRETFNVQKWNSVNQRFESLKCFGYDYSPDIHESLGYTYGLEIVMYFGDFLIRVDDAEPHNVTYGHSYKYTAWGKGKTMADVPDLILYGGELNEDDGTFHFTNEEYEYIVPCAENKFNNKLIVKKNGKVILQKEIKADTDGD